MHANQAVCRRIHLQAREDAPGPLSAVYRHISKGAWPFSTRDHGWPISDCSSEGLKAALGLAAAGPAVGGAPIPAERLFDAVNVILSYQNHDGGWATYENTRSFHALEVTSCSAPGAQDPLVAHVK